MRTGRRPGRPTREMPSRTTRGAREEGGAPRETETLDAPGDAIARTLARRTESAQPPPRARADAGEGRGRETLATTRDRVDEDRRHTDGAARSAPPTASAASGAMRSPAAPRSDGAPRLWAGKRATSGRRFAPVWNRCARAARVRIRPIRKLARTKIRPSTPRARVTFSRICARRGWSRRRAPRAGARSRPDPGRGRRPSPSRDGGFGSRVARSGARV